MTSDGGWTAADLPGLSGRTVVVTGANTGIGFAATRALADAGATVVFSDQTVSGRRLESSDQISDNSDGTTTVSGTVNNGMDVYTYGKDTHIKPIRVSGRGNIEMAMDGNVDERMATDGIEIKGTDKDGDGSSPSMPYSFSVNGPTAPNEDLESDDEESRENSVSGTITPGDSDYYFADSQFTEVHANVKKGDEVLIQRYST
jgi:hypothetical protein